MYLISEKKLNVTQMDFFKVMLVIGVIRLYGNQMLNLEQFCFMMGMVEGEVVLSLDLKILMIKSFICLQRIWIRLLSKGFQLIR